MPKSSTATEETKEYWDYVERIAKQVEGWPDWKKGKQNDPEEPSRAPSHSTGNKDVDSAPRKL